MRDEQDEAPDTEREPDTERGMPLTAAVMYAMAGDDPDEAEADFWNDWKDEMKERPYDLDGPDGMGPDFE